MTRMDELIGAQLIANATLVAVVGTRVYPEPLPAGVTLPAVTYFQVSSEFEQTFGSQAPAADIGRWQFTVWADKAVNNAYGTARAALAALKTAIVALTDSGTITLHSITIDNQIDLFDAEAVMYQVVVEATIHSEGG